MGSSELMESAIEQAAECRARHLVAMGAVQTSEKEVEKAKDVLLTARTAESLQREELFAAWKTIINIGFSNADDPATVAPSIAGSLIRTIGRSIEADGIENGVREANGTELLRPVLVSYADGDTLFVISRTPERPGTLSPFRVAIIPQYHRDQPVLVASAHQIGVPNRHVLKPGRGLRYESAEEVVVPLALSAWENNPDAAVEDRQNEQPTVHVLSGVEAIRTYLAARNALDTMTEQMVIESVLHFAGSGHLSEQSEVTTMEYLKTYLTQLIFYREHELTNVPGQDVAIPFLVSGLDSHVVGNMASQVLREESDRDGWVYGFSRMPRGDIRALEAFVEGEFPHRELADVIQQCIARVMGRSLHDHEVRCAGGFVDESAIHASVVHTLRRRGEVMKRPHEGSFTIRAIMAKRRGAQLMKLARSLSR